MLEGQALGEGSPQSSNHERAIKHLSMLVVGAFALATVTHQVLDPPCPEWCLFRRLGLVIEAAIDIPSVLLLCSIYVRSLGKYAGPSAGAVLVMVAYVLPATATVLVLSGVKNCGADYIGWIPRMLELSYLALAVALAIRTIVQSGDNQ
jgi:hypothetical protein